jgi:hypothetical protein
VVFLPNPSGPFGPLETSFRMRRVWTRGDKPKANAVVEGEAVAALFFFLFIDATRGARMAGGQATGPQRHGHTEGGMKST